MRACGGRRAHSSDVRSTGSPRGPLRSAKRHFALCRSLLPIEPDLVLGASLDLDESSLRSLIGDVTGALEIAKRAMRTAQVSGWSKGVVAAAANCAYFSVVIGDLESARRFVANATRERFQSPSYRLALDDTDARLASADGDVARAEALVGGGTSASTQPWYQLSAAETLVRLMSNQRRWREALDCSERALEFAKQTGTDSFIPLMELARSNALLGLGADPQRIGLPLELTASASSPSTTGSLYHVLGKALELSGSNAKGRAYLERSARITRESVKTSTTMDTTERNIDSSDVPGPPDLDSAVALIELGGSHAHPGAGGARGHRGGAVRAWRGDRGHRRRGTARHRHGAAGTKPPLPPRRGKPGACEVIPLGDHRDEPWQLVVDAAARPRTPLHADRHPQADRHRPHARPLSPRGEAARRAVARRGARRRAREHLGLRADGRGARRRPAHRPDSAVACC